MYASSGDDELKANANLMVAELARCQRVHGNGYLSAFPEEFFARLCDGKKVWTPFSPPAPSPPWGRGES
jgi:DUF1680 family protein